MSAVLPLGLDIASAPRVRSRILVVDDDESMLELLKLHLRKAGYDVLAANDAFVAGRLAVEQHPDLLIVDVHMPFMNGYEFVAALKADAATRHIPAVFLTSDQDIETVAEKSLRVGAATYLNKPISADRLLEMVAGIVPSAAGVR